MKYLISLTLFIIITISSCTNSPQPTPPEKDLPKPLTEESGSFEIVSKRGSDDLVESLYNELSDKTPALKDLEFKIDHVRKSKRDSLESFYEFNQKNTSFYQSANDHLGRINDSVLTEKIGTLITGSINKYHGGIQPYNGLINSIDQKSVKLNDLHAVLKIIQTLPTIEKYQIVNRPDIKGLKGYSKQLNEVIQIADTLIKK